MGIVTILGNLKLSYLDFYRIPRRMFVDGVPEKFFLNGRGNREKPKIQSSTADIFSLFKDFFIFPNFSFLPTCPLFYTFQSFRKCFATKIKWQVARDMTFQSQNFVQNFTPVKSFFVFIPSYLEKYFSNFRCRVLENIFGLF